MNVTDPDAPEILLAANPPIQHASGSGTLCGIDQCTGCVVNVVNFIRYDVATHGGDTELRGPLYDDGGAAPFDDTRTELAARRARPRTVTRSQDQQELVAQYAVDLKFGLMVDDRGAPALDSPIPARRSRRITPGSPARPEPHRIRGVRVRLSVRTRDADREVDINPTAAGRCSRALPSRARTQRWGARSRASARSRPT